MSIYEDSLYQEDLQTAIDSVVAIKKIYNSSIMITGATGLIGSFLVEMMLYLNEKRKANITIYALGRNKERLCQRFDMCGTDQLIFVEHDVNEEIKFDYQVDYLIHAASNAYPAAFRTNPVETIMSNIIGTQRLLDYANNHGTRRVLFVSSGEVYGQGDISIPAFEETYSGYMDSMQVRSCYPVSKRAAETLCCSYTEQYGLETVVVRPCHTYGPNVTKNDNRATVQFMNNVLNEEDIVLNSPGTQMRSYCYIADCASALMTVLIKGESKAAYNIANSQSVVTIAGFAKEVAKQAGRKIIFSNPDEVAKSERTPIAKQVLDSGKLNSLGWSGKYSLEKGVAHTISILRK